MNYNKHIIFIYLLFLWSAINSYGQNDSVYEKNLTQEDRLSNENNVSITFYGAGFKYSGHGPYLFLGLKSEIEFKNNNKFSYIVGVDLFSLNDSESWGTNINTNTFSIGVGYKLKGTKPIFISSALQIAYFKQDISRISGGYVHFNGGGLKMSFDVGLDYDLFSVGVLCNIGSGIGMSKEFYKTPEPVKVINSVFVPGIGVFFKYKF